MDVNPAYPLFPVFAFFGFFLVLIPLPWQIQVWNIGTCAYIFWTSVSCLVMFINSIVWRNNTDNTVPVWCDISSKILLGASVGIPAAGLCISRRLYVISAIRSAVVTRQDKLRAVILDSCIAFGLPIIVMALHYVVQGHRFDILEDVGCYPSIYDTLLSYFLIFMWPTILGCISFVFSALTLHAFHRRRVEFAQYLSIHSSLDMSRYIRLMVLAGSEMLCTIPISVTSTYIANKGVQIQPWISWANVHYDFSYVGQIPASEWLGNPNYRLSVEMTRWLFPASALLFFVLFGLGPEARKHYRATLLRVAECFGHKPAPEVPVHVSRKAKPDLSNIISVGSLPVYVARTSTCVQHADAEKCFDIDVENIAGCSSPSVSICSPRDQEPSSTATSSNGGDIDETVDDTSRPAPLTVPSPTAYRHTIPAYHRPFSLPSIYPTPHRTAQESRPLDNVYITVQTQYGTAA